MYFSLLLLLPSSDGSDEDVYLLLPEAKSALIIFPILCL